MNKSPRCLLMASSGYCSNLDNKSLVYRRIYFMSVSDNDQRVGDVYPLETLWQQSINDKEEK